MATAVLHNGTKMVAGLSPAVWECIYVGTEGGDHTTVEDCSTLCRSTLPLESVTGATRCSSACCLMVCPDERPRDSWKVFAENGGSYSCMDPDKTMGWAADIACSMSRKDRMHGDVQMLLDDPVDVVFVLECNCLNTVPTSSMYLEMLCFLLVHGESGDVQRFCKEAATGGILHWLIGVAGSSLLLPLSCFTSGINVCFLFSELRKWEVHLLPCPKCCALLTAAPFQCFLSPHGDIHPPSAGAAVAS